MSNDPIHGKTIITLDNVEPIIEAAAKRKWTIEHLRTSIEEATEFGEQTILYTAIYIHHPIPQIAGFNEVWYTPESTDDVPLMTTDEFITLIEMMPEVV